MVGQQSNGSHAFGLGLHTRPAVSYYSGLRRRPGCFPQETAVDRAEEQKLLSSEITATIDTYLKDHVYKKPEDRDTALEIVSKYIKGGNYLEIKDPILARSLLAALQEKFGTQEAKE